MKSNKNELLVRDSVCGMKIEPKYAADVDYYKSKVFYFCSYACLKEFNLEPEKYFEQELKVDENDRI